MKANLNSSCTICLNNDHDELPKSLVAICDKKQFHFETVLNFTLSNYQLPNLLSFFEVIKVDAHCVLVRQSISNITHEKS